MNPKNRTGGNRPISFTFKKRPLQFAVQIIDQSNNQPIPAASWVAADSSGNSLGVGGVASGQGVINVNTDLLDADSGYLYISSIGYSPVLIAADVARQTGYIDLLPTFDQLPTVTVTPGAVTKTNATPWVALAVLVAVAVSQSKNKKRMGAVNIDWQKLAITVGLAAGGYFLVLRPILIKLGILKTPGSTDDSTAAVNSSAATDQAIAALQDSGGIQAIETYPAANYAGFADDIYKQGTAGTVDMNAIKWDIIQANTLMDLLQIRKAFGARPAGGSFFSMCQLLSINCPLYDLDSFLKVVLDQSTLDSINQYLRSQSITYTF